MTPNQTPTYVSNVPDAPDGDGPMAAMLAEEYFGEPLEWQRYVLNALLARDEKDKYQCKTFGLTCPRQNGKSWIVRARCFHGLLNGEKILYTCQHGDTSDAMFASLSAPFEDNENVELHEMLVTVRKANGQQAIILDNGGLIRFTTRTDSLARGKTYDVLIYDEAQELTDSQQAASLPAISAGPKHNPQTIYLGTAPEPGKVGTVFKNLHRDVHSGTSKMPWVEWGVDEVGDVSDMERWYETNPSLGVLLDLSALQGELEQMQPDTFARERLGWWAPLTALLDIALDTGSWEKQLTDTPVDGKKLSFGVKFSPDGARVAISWAVTNRGGDSYVELYDVRDASEGTRAIADLLLRNKSDIACVCIDGKSGSDALIQRLDDAKFPKAARTKGTAAIVQAAASMLREEINAGTLWHIESPALDDSATKSTRRKIGHDGWGFDDGMESIAAPIESASLALWASRTTTRNPERKQEANF